VTQQHLRGALATAHRTLHRRGNQVIARQLYDLRKRFGWKAAQMLQVSRIKPWVTCDVSVQFCAHNALADRRKNLLDSIDHPLDGCLTVLDELRICLGRTQARQQPTPARDQAGRDVAIQPAPSGRVKPGAGAGPEARPRS